MTEILPTGADSAEEENPPDHLLAQRTNTRSTRQTAKLGRKSLAVIDSPNMAIANFLLIATHEAPKTVFVISARLAAA